VEDPPEIAERKKGHAKVETEIDALLDRGATLGEMIESTKRALVERHRFAVGRTRGGLESSPSQIDDGLRPDFAFRVVDRQSRRVGIEIVRVEIFQGSGNPAVQQTSMGRE